MASGLSAPYMRMIAPLLRSRTQSSDSLTSARPAICSGATICFKRAQAMALACLSRGAT